MDFIKLAQDNPNFTFEIFLVGIMYFSWQQLEKKNQKLLDLTERVVKAIENNTAIMQELKEVVKENIKNEK
jgi:hypothetical protein